MTGCKVCGERFEGQRYPGQLCSRQCRAEQRKRTRAENAERCTVCAGPHRPVAAYGGWCCPDALGGRS